jgi:hypothetical protein
MAVFKSVAPKANAMTGAEALAVKNALASVEVVISPCLICTSFNTLANLRASQSA